MNVKLFRADGVTPLNGSTIPNEQAGFDSDVVHVRVKNVGDTVAKNVLLVQRTVDPANPDNLLATGVPPQDEGWGRNRITGSTAPAGDPTWIAQPTAWYSAGAWSGLLLGDIPAGGIVHVEYLSRPPSGAETAPWVRVLVPIYDAYSQPLPPALTRVDRGVLPGIGDFSHYGLISGLGVTVSGTPDAQVHSAAGFWVHAGILYGDIARSWTFNNLDSAASALTAGQHYWIVQSRGAGVTNNTKGVRGTSPAKPAMPAGDIFVRCIRIDYQAGGTPVIEALDLDGTTLYDRYLPEDGGGLDVYMHPGQAQGGSTWRYSAGKLPVDGIEDDTTNYVWQLASGLFVAGEDEYEPPEATAIGPLCEVETAAGDIVSIVDRRPYAGRAESIHIGGDTPGGVGALVAQTVLARDVVFEDFFFQLSDGGAGASAGQTKLDVRLDGVTIFTDFATSDQRPVVAYNAAGTALIVNGRVHQVTRGRRGQVLSLHVIELPTGGTPARIDVTALCRIP